MTSPTASISYDATDYLTRSRHHVVRAIAVGFLVVDVLVMVGSALAYALAPSGGTLALIAALVWLLIGAAATVAMPSRRPLTAVVAPLAAGLCGIIVTIGLLLPEIRNAAMPFMGFVVLLISMASNRRLTVAVGALCTVLTVTILVAPPLMSLSLGPLAPALQVVAPAVATVLIGMVAHNVHTTQAAALEVAVGQTARAETARAEAEAARAETEARSAEQRRLHELVQELELPVLAVGQGVLAVPLVGQLDQRRLASITAGVLQSVSQHRAHTVIFDITGVPTVDAVVGHALVDASQAVRLLGSRVMLSGVRPGVAMTLSQLGVDLSGVAPVADLRNALSA